jgi:dihydroflavonol-4-reductase
VNAPLGLRGARRSAARQSRRPARRPRGTNAAVKVLVTGATGFVGKALVPALVAAGHDVRCLVRPTSKSEALTALGVELVVGNVTEPASLTEAARGVDAVFHLAAMLAEPWHPDFLRTNATGVRHVLEACAALPTPPRVVLTSSLAAVGPSVGAPRTEDDAPAPVSRYGASKLAGEAAARELADRLPITIVRPPAVFGPHDPNFLAAFQSAARGIGVDFGAVLSMIHVGDLAAMLRIAAERGETVTSGGSLGTGVYFAAHDEAPTSRELWSMLGDVLGRKVRVIRIPKLAVRAAGALAEVGGRLGMSSLMSRDKALEAVAGAWTCSPEKAKALGWTPAPLATRLAETATWYRAQGQLS